MRRILITGANGQVGFELQRALAPLGDVTCVTREQADLTNPQAIRDMLDRVQPDVIVNPAAYTAVDKAESDADVACAINAAAPGLMAEWTAAHGTLLVHYSTDYVFDGTKSGPYVEDDETNPQSVYGLSKWQGEEAIRKTKANHLILRTSWVVGAHGNNFLKTVLRLAREREQLKIIADQIGAPTTAALIADVTAQLVARHVSRAAHFVYGTYHLTAAGEASWYDYALYVVGLAEKSGFTLKLGPQAILPIPTSEYPLPAKRPANSRLDVSKLTGTFGLHMPDWRRGIDHVFAQITDGRQS
jgi:dTDP-4-dehydrorhamnose reductase